MAKKPVKRDPNLNKPVSSEIHRQSATNKSKPVNFSDPVHDSDETVQMDFEMEHKSPNAAFIDPKGGIQVLGRGVKELVQAVQALRHLGIEDTVLPLPKIVVVGDQSTGKSSLIEGMSEIKVPRSAGTCTRCPLEINLSESADDAWSCKIYLHKKYMYEGTLGTSRPYGKNLHKVEGATRSRPLGPWREQESEEFHFATITSKTDVEIALYLAQLATLNPSSPYEKYLPGNPTPLKHHQVKFSPNVVRLDISGTGLPNLSFYDLPGVINVSDVAEEEYLVDLVKNLVKDYIKAEDCINLLAIPLTDDPANSSASRLIREAKAEARTVGCLTKPDRLQDGESLEQWIRILKGERFQLGFGYFVIKNNPDPNVDHEIARQEEEAFFTEEEPWNSILRSHSDRFGTLLLQTALSQRLTAQIQKSLPRITEQVAQKAESITTQLSGLPEPIEGNLAAIVLGELTKFEKQIEKQFDGGSQANLFQAEWNGLQFGFRQTLAETRPVLKLPPPPTPVQSQSTHGSIAGTPTPAGRGNAVPINIDSDEDDETPSEPSPRSGNKRSLPYMPSTPNKLLRTTDGTPRGTNIKPQRKIFDIAGIGTMIRNAYMTVPGQVHPNVTETMIKTSMAHWEEPVERFLDQTKSLCENLVHEQVERVLGHRRNTTFYENVMDICNAFFEDVFSEQCKLVKVLLGSELTRPKTLNAEALNVARDKAQSLLQMSRHEARAAALVEEQENGTTKITKGQARLEKVGRVTEAQLPSDPFSLEISAMSTVKAYYECAFSRFVDNVCMTTEFKVFQSCRNDIVPEMKKKFGILEAGANDRLAISMAVDPEHERRRVQLMKEQDTLQKALEKLESLSTSDLAG